MTKTINIMATWKEFAPNAARSMRDDISDKPQSYFTEVIAYLNDGAIKLIAPGRSIDVLSGEPLGQTRKILTDGEYSWSDTLPYYVEKYNLRLPQAFISKVLSLKNL